MLPSNIISDIDLSQQENEDSQYTIQRCPHDRENPYAQISREFIRDMSISPDCHWLIDYLLSNRDGWKISVANIQKIFKKWWGRDKVWEIFNEAIEAGYMKREVKKNDGRFQTTIYYLSETPKFKKCLPHTEFPGTETSGPENQGYKNKQDYISRKSIEKKKEQEKERENTSVSSLKKQKKATPDKKAYRENVFLTEEEYQKLLTRYGHPKLEWMLDYLHAKKGAKTKYEYDSDYHVLLPANWVNGEYEKLCSSGKIEKMTPPTECSLKNKKMCELAETKLKNSFNSFVFFQAGPSKAILSNKNKDYNKDYEYDKYSTDALKEILLKDLDTCFPGAKDILMGTQHNKISNLMNNLTQQFKMKQDT